MENSVKILGFIKGFDFYFTSRIRSNNFVVRRGSMLPASSGCPFFICYLGLNRDLSLATSRYQFFTIPLIRGFFCSSSLVTRFSSRLCRNPALPASPCTFLSIPAIRACSSLPASLFSNRLAAFHINSALLRRLYLFLSVPAISFSIGPPFLVCYSDFHTNLGLRTFPFPSIGLSFCSSSHSSCTLDQISDANLSNLQHECLSQDFDKVYNAIIENSRADQSMETALELLAINLTTEVVERVLQKLRFEEKLAFRFFTWATHQEGYTHQSQTYNEMIDILSSTKYKAKQFRIVCDMLDYMKKKKGSVPLEVLLTILRQYTEKHLSHLQKFTKKKKIRIKTQPGINAFNLLLDSLCKCGLVQEAKSMFNRVKIKLTPDAKTYNILFFGWCRVRKPTEAMVVLEEMINAGHTPDNFTYNAALDAFCSAGMVSEASELFEFMRTKGSTVSSPTAKTYSIMIVAFAKSNKMEECFRIIADMRNSGCLPDVSTYTELIEGMCLAGKIEEAYKFLEEMGNKGYPPDIVTYNCFLKVLCNLKKDDEALRLYRRIIEVGCLPSVHTFNMLITMFFEIGEADGAFEMWHEMGNSNCARDIDTYCAMVEGCFSCDRMEDASALLEDVVNKGMRLPFKKFEAFLAQLSGIGDLRTIHRLSEHMRRFYNPAMARRFAMSQKRKSVSLRRQ